MINLLIVLILLAVFTAGYQLGRIITKRTIWKHLDELLDDLKEHMDKEK